LKTHFDPNAPSVPIKAKCSISAKVAKDVPLYLEGGGMAIGDFMDLLKKHDQIKK